MTFAETFFLFMQYCQDHDIKRSVLWEYAV